MLVNYNYHLKLSCSYEYGEYKLCKGVLYSCTLVSSSRHYGTLHATHVAAGTLFTNMQTAIQLVYCYI